MEPELVVTGAIIDSWVEPAGPSRDASRLVLQVAPRAPRGGGGGNLMIVEAAASLVPDRGWLEDLGANLCHGSLVAVEGRLTRNGLLAARRLRLDR